MKIKKTYAAKLDNLDEIYVDIENFCDESGVDEKSKFALNLCLDEIFTNIVTYGYKNDESKSVEIELEKSGDNLSATVRDDAPAFNPLSEISAPDLSSNTEEREIGGLGVFFVKENMNSVSYKYTNKKNELTMARKIAEK